MIHAVVSKRLHIVKLMVKLVFVMNLVMINHVFVKMHSNKFFFNNFYNIFYIFNIIIYNIKR